MFRLFTRTQRARERVIIRYYYDALRCYAIQMPTPLLCRLRVCRDVGYSRCLCFFCYADTLPLICYGRFFAVAAYAIRRHCFRFFDAMRHFALLICRFFFFFSPFYFHFASLPPRYFRLRRAVFA